VTHRVLLDVDTGVDDALAILFAVAHPDIELVGITCVAGNTSLENVVANTLKVLDVAGAPDIPVAAGAVRTCTAPTVSATSVCPPRRGFRMPVMPSTSPATRFSPPTSRSP
jgi:pyrimidine-specific ribonucleoside hydrolase